MPTPTSPILIDPLRQRTDNRTSHARQTTASMFRNPDQQGGDQDMDLKKRFFVFDAPLSYHAYSDSESYCANALLRNKVYALQFWHLVTI